MGTITRTFANQIKTGGKLDADGLDLTDTFAFSGTVTGTNGAFKLLTRTAITSDVASVDFTDLTAGYIHLFHLVAIDGTNNGGEDLIMRVSTDNGSTFISSGYKNLLWQTHSSGTNNQYQTDGILALGDAFNNSDTAEGFHGHVYLSNVNDSSQKCAAYGQGFHFEADANTPRNNNYAGHYDTAAAVDAVQFLFETGNITGSTKAFITHYIQVIA